jgi:hypothetical protein
VNEFTVTNLSPFTRYLIKIKACLESDICGIQSQTVVRTKAGSSFGMVPWIEATQQNDDIFIEWGGLNAVVLNYIVVYSRIDIEDSVETRICLRNFHKGSIIKYVIEDLEPGMYEVKIASTTFAGQSDFFPLTMTMFEE